jgi:hypothetical protein
VTPPWTPRHLSAEAAWLLDEALALAASSRAGAFDTVHVLAAAFRSDTTFGAALRASAVAAHSADLDGAVAAREGGQRIPVYQVQAAADVTPVLEAAARRAEADGRIRIDAEDIVWALTVVLGPHSRFFATDEPAARSALIVPVPGQDTKRHRRPNRPRPARRRTRGVLWAAWTTLMNGANAGVTILLAGAGVVLHHAGVELVGLLSGFKVAFKGWTEQIGGRLQTSRVLSLREAFAATLLVRLLLAIISVTTFAVVLLESRGVGLSPWPVITGDPAAALGSQPDPDRTLGLLLATGRRTIELWIAVGAGFMAVPTFGEVDRIRQLLATGRRRARILAAMLEPLRGVTWLFDRFDAVTSLIPGFPAMLSSGMTGVVVSAVAGLKPFELAISVAA